MLRRRGEPLVLRLDEEDRGLGVFELEAELRRREPPIQWQQDETGLRAREEDNHVLRRVTGERGNAVTVAKPAREELSSERIGAAVQLPVRDLAAEVVDRDALRRAPRGAANPVVDRVHVHSRKPSTSATSSSGRSQGSRWPTPSNNSSRAPGIAFAITGALPASTTLSAVPWMTSVCARISPRRSIASCATPAPAWAYQPAPSGGFAVRYATISSTSAGGGSG